jgi:PilZ domain-containing protein
VADACTVVIGAADLLPALTERSGAFNGEVLAFSDHDAVLALEEIVRRRPGVVALERQFAATPRGAALINRIKADPELAGSELRVVAHDSDYERVLPRPAIALTVSEEPAPAEAAEAAPVRAPLDHHGTRRALRFKIAGDMSVLLDGNSARLIDLSEVGAQVVSTTVLKPNQRVRVALTDDHGALRFNGAIAWAAFEIPPRHGPQYRAGVNFVDADGDAVGAFCMRHKQS